MMKPTFVLLVATALLSALRLEASSQYAILPIGPFGTVSTTPVDMDDQSRVVGTYSERPLAAALVGSTPHKLLHLSNHPVLVVPVPDEE